MHEILAQPLFWLGCVISLVVGGLVGAAMHRSQVRRKRRERAYAHLRHLFATGLVHELRYQPVRRWLGLRRDSHVIAKGEHEEFEVMDTPRYGREHSYAEVFAGFTPEEVCLAAQLLSENHEYVRTQWVPERGYRRKAWILKRRPEARSAS